MSIEFVDPDEAAPVRDTPPAPRGSVLPGRLLGGTGLVAAASAGLAVLVPLYDVVRTAFVIDFDGTTTQDARVPYDAFGHAETVPLTITAGGFPNGTDATFTREVSLSDSISYAPWWLALAAVLLLAAGWALARPHSSRPAAVVAAVGALLLGSVGTAWLQIRTVSTDSVPQIRFEARPDLGLWLVAVAGTLALLAGLLAATRPPLRRLLPRRRRG